MDHQSPLFVAYRLNSCSPSVKRAVSSVAVFIIIDHPGFDEYSSEDIGRGACHDQKLRDEARQVAGY
jgi:hypothetical protein